LICKVLTPKHNLLIFFTEHILPKVHAQRRVDVVFARSVLWEVP